MRVLHVYKAYLPESVGGIEQVIFQLCESLHAQGVQSEVLTLSTAPRQLPASLGNHKVHRVQQDLYLASTGFSLGLLERLKTLAAEVDLVHYHFPWPFMDALHFAARLGKPYVVSYHLDIVRQKWLLHLYRPLMMRFLRGATRIIAASPNYVESSPILAHFRDKVEIITYGLDRNSYAIPEPHHLQRWQARLGGEFFLFVGVMRYYKGLHVLLEAAKGANFPVVIVGTGPLEAELHAQARLMNLTNVHFVGALEEPDKVALLQLCRAIVLPSHLRSESFGISLLEGAMLGKVMISCEIGSGTSYINQHGQTGLVVPPSNPVALRSAMDELWSNPDRAEAMGRKAQQRYWQLFTAEQMGGNVARLYRSVLGDTETEGWSHA